MKMILDAKKAARFLYGALGFTYALVEAARLPFVGGAYHNLDEWDGVKWVSRASWELEMIGAPGEDPQKFKLETFGCFGPDEFEKAVEGSPASHVELEMVEYALLHSLEALTALSLVESLKDLAQLYTGHGLVPPSDLVRALSKARRGEGEDEGRDVLEKYAPIHF